MQPLFVPAAVRAKRVCMSSGNTRPPSIDDRAPGHEPQVLIVDDEPVILDLLRDVLEEAGYAVLSASNGAAALYLVQRAPVALILTDLMMPNMSGIELARRVRANADTQAIPLVLMSAAMPKNVDDLFAAVIHKPFAIDQVVEVVRKVQLA